MSDYLRFVDMLTKAGIEFRISHSEYDREVLVVTYNSDTIVLYRFSVETEYNLNKIQVIAGYSSLEQFCEEEM